MNLVVVAAPAGGRRALRGDDPAADRPPPVADGHRLAGRPGRPVVARRRRSRPTASCRGEDAPETCAELIYLTVGGESGQHLDCGRRAAAHPRPAGDRLVAGRAAVPDAAGRATILRMADRLVVDGSTWSGRRPAAAPASSPAPGRDRRLAVSDFALIRQSRWREAIASIFDCPEFLPFLGSLRRISVAYATHDETGAPGSTNIVKPVYHVAWLASRLGLRVEQPLAPSCDTARRRTASGATGAPPDVAAASRRCMRDGRHEVAGVIRPVVSPMPAGTTLRVEILAERRGSELRADVTAVAGIGPRPRLARRRRGARPRSSWRRAGPTSTCWPRRSRRAAGTRSRSRRCGWRPQLAGAERRRPDRRGRRPGWRGPMTEPTTTNSGRPGRAGGARPARRRRRLRRAAAADRATAPATPSEQRGRADWATTGGSAPVGIYRRLAEPPLREQVPWRNVHIWWGDDRYVPRDHPLSNVLPADQVLVDAAPGPGSPGRARSRSTSSSATSPARRSRSRTSIRSRRRGDRRGPGPGLGRRALRAGARGRPGSTSPTAGRSSTS